jgi:ATP-dependent Lhr-like helicase
MPWAGHMALYAMPEIYAALRASTMSIVFVNTRAQAELIFQNLWLINEDNLRIALHHGSLERELRRKVEDNMARGMIDCVVATSSLDLGLDWAEVDLVVQIGAPKGVSRLLQRIGRSNHRLNEPSRALLVPTNRFEYLECLAAQAAIAHHEIDGVQPRKGGLDVLAQHIFGTACSAPFDAAALYREIITTWPYHALSRADFDKVLHFVIDGGYVLKAYERFKRLQVNEDGLYALSDPRLARQYRMNIGTIVEAPMLKVKMGRRPLGVIEEYFINNLSPGDTFYFAGEVVRFDGLRDTVVMVSRTKGGDPKIPSYDGGKLPLTTHLSKRVRMMLSDEQHWPELPGNVRHWLEHQKERSELPGTGHLLVETFPRGGRHYLVAYPFAGRAAHQTLGFLMMRRLERQGDKPLGFVATDYAIAVWSLKAPRNIADLFSVDLLGEALHEWLEDTPLLKRTFREAAVIAGIIERRHPGQQKTGRQMTFSSDLIYDVLYKYEPQHILLQAAVQDAHSGLIDIDRLSALLHEVKDHIVIKHLKKISPLAVPLILEIARESTSRQKAGDYYLEDLEQNLLAEAGLEESA